MPKQKRWQLKRQLEQAVNDLDRCQRNLIIVAADFEDIHHEYYVAISAILQGIELTKAAVSDLSAEI